MLDSDGPLAPFRDVENLAELNTSYNESEVAVSADGLAIFWGETTRNFRPEGLGWGDVWMATRPARVDRVTGERVPFRNARNVGRPVNGDVPEGGPCVSGSWPEGGSKLLFHRVVGTPDDWNSWICEAAWVAAESSPP